jgi:ATP-dependent helicase/nuclease subunit A
MKLSVYRSSAGSGKTFTLTKEYLKLVLPDPFNYRRILAITFTNAAAAEMKTRIIENLIKISTDPDFFLSKIQKMKD